MMLHVTGRGFIAQQPHTRKARNGVTDRERLSSFDGYNFPVGLSVGLSGMGSGMGMTAEEARVMLATGNGTAEQLKAANVAYYGPQVAGAAHTSGGYYGSNPSVIAAANGGGEIVPQPPYPGNSEPLPNLYPMENCDPMDGACQVRNKQREVSNQILTNNARNQYNRDMCEYDYALNVNQSGNTSLPHVCAQYTIMAVPPAPGVPSTPVSSGGQVMAAVMGQTVNNTPSGTTPVYAPQTTPTLPNNQAQAAVVTNRPNQTVPPNPSPGTVPINPLPSTAQTLLMSSVNGTAPPVDNKTSGDPFGILSGELWGIPEWILLAGGAVVLVLLVRKS